MALSCSYIKVCRVEQEGAAVNGASSILAADGSSIILMDILCTQFEAVWVSVHVVVGWSECQTHPIRSSVVFKGQPAEVKISIAVNSSSRLTAQFQRVT